MIYLKNFIYLTLFVSIFTIAACDKDEVPIIDTELKVLSQKLNGEAAINGAVEVARDIAIELIFSHSLNTSALESALSFSSSAGNVDYTIEYSNTNSTITISNNNPLDYETVYTLTVASGSHSATEETLKEAYSLSFTTAVFVPANVSLSSDMNSMNEDGGSVMITATLNEVVASDVTIELAFGGSAAATDFTATSTSLVILSGETAASIQLNAEQDGALEGTESIEISIAAIENAIEISPQLITVDLVDDDIDSNGDGFPDRGFIINEVLFDPASGDPGDANGDGTRSASEDEFIEFINDSDTGVDLSGYTLFDATNLETMEPRHTFPDNTIVPAGGVYVLFGGGTPAGDFGTALIGVSTSGNMNLSNGDDVITILDLAGNVFLTFDTQDEGAGLDFGGDQSVTRFEDINGDFTLHTTANVDLLFSPGKKTDGSNFDGTVSNAGEGFIINEVLFDPASGDPGDANGDGTRSASEDEFIEFVNDSDTEVDLSGYTLFDATNLETMEPRHTFPDGTIIPAQGVYVLFGGGTPSGGFGGAQVGVSTTGNMNLTNSADVITILDELGNVFITFDTGIDGLGLDFGADQAVTRSPDITGDFMLQMDINAAFLYTPGTKNDGSPFLVAFCF